MDYISELKKLYIDYGFNIEREYNDEGVIVFSHSSGYFNNVDIVPLSPKSECSRAFDEYTEIGYSCSIKEYRSIQRIKAMLFDGFFCLGRTRNKFLAEYERYAESVVGVYGLDASYQYLESPYFVNDSVGNKSNVVDEIVSTFNLDIPVLYLVEAAAGFGKTCTAYEIAKEICNIEGKVPLLAELSRDRQARVFKHILLSEVDRVFPSLSSGLVEKEIKSGNVVTILDGFDELLRDGEESDFDIKEPMLETIGQYLEGCSKIILTTRKTVLFEGDGFFEWVEKNIDKFSLVRLRLGEPKIRDWLSRERYDSIIRTVGGQFDKISNPVLLSYLRCIGESDFREVCSDPEKVVNKYFNFMLKRERERQELELDVDEQEAILIQLAGEMVEQNFVAEDREYVVEVILEGSSSIINKAVDRYPSENRPSREEMANKLASHALLDRSLRYPNKIGFLNDFVMGNYVALSAISSNGWVDDNWSFIEAAVISYKHRRTQDREDLYESLEDVQPYLSMTERIFLSTLLRNNIGFELIEDQAESLEFDGVFVGDLEIRDFSFISCSFVDCVFSVENMRNVSFIACQFFGCLIEGEVSCDDIYLIKPHGDQEFIDSVFKSNSDVSVVIPEPEKHIETERFVLEKFWPVGRNSVSHKHRPIKGICSNGGAFSVKELYSAIESLKEKGLLKEPKSVDFLEFNFEKMAEIKNVLGR